MLNSSPENGDAALLPELPTESLARLLADPEAETPAPAAREGLPRSYRMRADRHYVEELDTVPAADPRPRRAATRDAVAEKPQAILAAAPAIEHELTEVFTVLGSCANLLRSGTTKAAQSVSVELMVAEIWRATCLLHAGRVLRREEGTVWASFAASDLLDDVLDAARPWCRLRDAQPRLAEALPKVTVQGDRNQLITALSAMLAVTVDLLGAAPNRDIQCGATVDVDGTIHFVIEQHAVAPAAMDAAAGLSWADYTTDPAGRLWLVAAHQIAGTHGGHLTAERRARGTTLRLSIPLGASA